MPNINFEKFKQYLSNSETYDEREILMMTIALENFIAKEVKS